MESLTPEEARKLLAYVELQTEHILYLQARLTVLQASVDTVLTALAGIVEGLGNPRERIDAELKASYKSHLARLEQETLEGPARLGEILRGEREVEIPPEP